MQVNALRSAEALPELGTDGTVSPRVKAAAHEFEASLMKELLEPMQKQSLFADEKDGDDEGGVDSGSGNALMSFGSEAMAKAISERGGFGIATKLIEHFQKSGRKSDAGGKAKLPGALRF
jgi:Rod binding domain-containing protein